MALLETKGVTKFFGGIRALYNVDIEVRKGEILGLIGPNGAGKTTLFNIITGFYKPTEGKIFFEGEDITGQNPDEIAKKGIARTFQLVQVFPTLSVLENVLAAALYGREEILTYEEGLEEAFKALEFIGMEKFAYKLVNTLVITDRKKIELARALATNPKLILLDEIIAGLNPSETSEMMEIIKKVNKEKGITIVMVEHVMRAVMSISDRIVVLHYGEKIAEGEPKEIANNPKVIEAYLGEEAGEVLKFVKG